MAVTISALAAVLVGMVAAISVVVAVQERPAPLAGSVAFLNERSDNFSFFSFYCYSLCCRWRRLRKQ